MQRPLRQSLQGAGSCSASPSNKAPQDDKIKSESHVMAVGNKIHFELSGTEVEAALENTKKKASWLMKRLSRLLESPGAPGDVCTLPPQESPDFGGKFTSQQTE